MRADCKSARAAHEWIPVCMPSCIWLNFLNFFNFLNYLNHFTTNFLPFFITIPR